MLPDVLIDEMYSYLQYYIHDLESFIEWYGFTTKIKKELNVPLRLSWKRFKESSPRWRLYYLAALILFMGTLSLKSGIRRIKLLLKDGANPIIIFKCLIDSTIYEVNDPPILCMDGLLLNWFINLMGGFENIIQNECMYCMIYYANERSDKIMRKIFGIGDEKVSEFGSDPNTGMYYNRCLSCKEGVDPFCIANTAHCVNSNVIFVREPPRYYC